MNKIIAKIRGFFNAPIKIEKDFSSIIPQRNFNMFTDMENHEFLHSIFDENRDFLDWETAYWMMQEGSDRGQYLLFTFGLYNNKYFKNRNYPGGVTSTAIQELFAIMMGNFKKRIRKLINRVSILIIDDSEDGLSLPEDYKDSIETGMKYLSLQLQMWYAVESDGLILSKTYESFCRLQEIKKDLEEL